MFKNIMVPLKSLVGFQTRPQARHRAGKPVKAQPAPVQERKTPDLSQSFGDADPADLTVYEVMPVLATHLDNDAGRSAWRAMTTLAHYEENFDGVNAEPLRTVMVDVLTDMQNLAAVLGADFWSILDESSVHFAHEPVSR